jgi:hypothetical protein
LAGEGLWNRKDIYLNIYIKIILSIVDTPKNTPKTKNHCHFLVPKLPSTLDKMEDHIWRIRSERWDSWRAFILIAGSTPSFLNY